MGQNHRKVTALLTAGFIVGMVFGWGSSHLLPLWAKVAWYVVLSVRLGLELRALLGVSR